MTSTLSNVGALLASAAAAAAELLTLDEAVTPRAVDGTADFSAAVLVPFSGAVSGELAIMVDAGLAALLAGAGDLPVALGPAIAAAAATLGPVSTGAAQLADVRLARHRVASFAEHGEIGLWGVAGPRAAVALGVQPAMTEFPATPVSAPSSVPLARLELLRGVEMQASVELGRARMTINELLALHAGAVIELDRAAGDPADLYVNGRLMARGEVVVVDENYGLRITEIIADETSR